MCVPKRLTNPGSSTALPRFEQLGSTSLLTVPLQTSYCAIAVFGFVMYGIRSFTLHSARVKIEVVWSVHRRGSLATILSGDASSRAPFSPLSGSVSGLPGYMGGW